MANNPKIANVCNDCHDLPCVEWFMSLPDPNPEQAALVSVMTGALTGAFGLFLGKKNNG